MKNITIRQLRIFESVTRSLSFSRAAEDLHLSQPAVSMQIKQIEELAGMPLFLHVGRRIALTEAGELLLRHCRVILADLKAAELSMAHLKTGATHRLRVGVITSGSYLFPHLISHYLHGHDGVELDLTVRNRDQLIALLNSGQIDLAVLVYAPDDPHFTAATFAPNPFVMVAAPEHPLAGRHGIPFEQITHERLMVREPGTDTRHAADEIFLDDGAVSSFMEVSCAEALKESIMAGMGIGLLAVQAVQRELRSGLLTMLDVQGFPLRRHWCVTHRNDRHLPEPALHFRQFLLDEGSSRLALHTGIESVQTGMAASLVSPAAANARHEVALRTRALLRGESLPEQDDIEADDRDGGQRGQRDQLARGGKATHH